MAKLTWGDLERAVNEKSWTALSSADVRSALMALEKGHGRPVMVVGPPLRARWEHEDSIFEVRAEPRAEEIGDGTGVAWTLHAWDAPSRDIVGLEHLTMRYAHDDELYAPPYVWNLRVHREKWIQDDLAPVLTWASLRDDVGAAVSQLPATLEALPPAWFDAPAEMRFAFTRFPRALSVTARSGLLAMNVGSLGDDGLVGSEFTFDSEAALRADAGRLALSAAASCFDSAFLAADLSAHLAVFPEPPVRLSDIIFSDPDAMIDEPNPATIDALAEVATWARLDSYSMDAPGGPPVVPTNFTPARDSRITDRRVGAVFSAL